MSQSWKRKRKEIKTSGSNANSTWLKRGRALRGAKLAIRVGSQTGVGILEKYKEKKMARRLLINMQIVGGRAKFSLRVSLGSYHQRVFLSLTLLSFYLSVSLPLSYSPFFSFSLSIFFTFRDSSVLSHVRNSLMVIVRSLASWSFCYIILYLELELLERR